MARDRRFEDAGADVSGVRSPRLPARCVAFGMRRIANACMTHKKSPAPWIEIRGAGLCFKGSCG